VEREISVFQRRQAVNQIDFRAESGYTGKQVNLYTRALYLGVENNFYERHLSAEKKKKKKNSRFFGAPADFLRPAGCRSAAPQGAGSLDRVIMLPRVFHLSKQGDLAKVFRRGKIFQDSFFILRLAANDLDCCRAAIIISGKVSRKAVWRNRWRRQIKEILRLSALSVAKGYDLTITVKKPLFKQRYQDIKNSLIRLFGRAGLAID
jgi:ribonuclease P protein component